MKRIPFSHLILLAFTGVFAQQVVDNPEKPLSKKAGRVIQLTEEIRITDNQGGFYFKGPTNIKVAPDGGIFCLDEEQFLKFDEQGRYLKNLFKKGQGPGEFQRIDNYLFADGDIVVHQRGPDKIVRMDMDGRLIKDFRPAEAVTKMLAYYKDKYVMAQNSFPKIENIRKEEGSILDVVWNIAFLSEDGRVEKTDHLFPTKWFAKRLPGAVIADYVTDLVAVPFDDKYLAISHTQDYRLQVLDLEKNQLINSFKRKYKSVRNMPEKASPDDKASSRRRLEVPRDFHNDVQQIFASKVCLWVLTSTRDENKGFLIDVFDSQGRYIDNFYLPLAKSIKLDDLSRWPMTISGDSLFVVEKDRNDIPAIVKYRMI